MFKALSAAAIAAITFIAPASAATLSGTFTIDIYHRINANSAQSAATQGNLNPAEFLQTVSYTGDLDFLTNIGNATTIGSWLATGVNGVVTGLSAATSAIQLSSADINNGTAITTFFDITASFASGFNSIIRHDDGISVFDDGSQIATSSNPTVAIDTAVDGFNGGKWRLIYAATNSDPSVLKVTGDNLPATVPLPAGLPLLLAGLGGLAVLRRRSKKA